MNEKKDTTKSKEVYLVVFEHPGDDCHLTHAFFYSSEQEARDNKARFSRGGNLLVVHGLIVDERVDESYPTSVHSDS